MPGTLNNLGAINNRELGKEVDDSLVFDGQGVFWGVNDVVGFFRPIEGKAGGSIP